MDLDLRVKKHNLPRKSLCHPLCPLKRKSLLYHPRNQHAFHNRYAVELLTAINMNDIRYLISYI
jgi:hypothetical protein